MSFVEISNNILKESTNEKYIPLLKKLISIPYPVPEIPQENVNVLYIYNFFFFILLFLY